MDLEGARSDVVELLEGNAQWRERKAAQYRDDERNLDAAEESRRLAAALAELPPEAFEAYAEAEARLWGEEEDDEQELRVMDWNEAQSALLRSLGFQWFPHDAAEVLEALTALFEDYAASAEED